MSLTKNQIRKFFKERRKSLKKEEVEILSERFRKNFIENLEVFTDSGKNISGYIPFGNELDILPCLELLKDKGFNISLPVIRQKNSSLVFRGWDMNFENLISSKFYKYIKEPSEKFPEVIPDIILVPAVGVDIYGNRVGQGGGFYDRTIRHYKKENPNLKTVCVVYDFQIVKQKIPVDEFDSKIDFLLSEEKFLRYV